MAEPTLPEGMKAYYLHVREYDYDSERGRVLNPRGGLTECIVLTEDDHVVAYGAAQCHPNDNYNKKIGRSIALGRALKEYERQELRKAVEAAIQRTSIRLDSIDGSCEEDEFTPFSGHDMAVPRAAELSE